MKKTVITLDFMRFVAALMVVFYHFTYYGGIEKEPGGIGEILQGRVIFKDITIFSSWGWVGVYIFFVISGFVILMSAQGKAVFEFAVGRVLRIYPALALFATISLLVLVVLSELSWTELVRRWGLALVLYPRGPWIDGAIWTLTVEAIFYIIIGFLVFCGLLNRAFSLAVLYLLVTSFFWALVAWELYTDRPLMGYSILPIAWAYSSKVIFLTTGQFFSLGMLLYDRFAYGSGRLKSTFIVLAICQGALSIYVFALRSPAVVIDGHSPFVPAVVWVVVILACVAATSIERTWSISPFWGRTARRFGLLTYPLYLSNQILGAAIIALFLKVGFGAVGSAWLAFGSIMLLSWLFSEYLERPIRSWMRSIIMRARKKDDVRVRDSLTGIG